MNRPCLDVAAVIRSCYDAFLEKYGAELTPEQWRALNDLMACRTAALGGHVLGCPECGHQEIAYNSCGNRHCPKCHGTATARWLETQAADLLDVPYYAQQDVMLNRHHKPWLSRDSRSKSSA